jgi:hypothetical protein
VKFQNRLSGTTWSFGLGAFSDDAVPLLTDGELELNLHLSLASVNQVIIALGSGFSPECPGHGVNQGGFAIAVIAREASNMDAFKIEYGHIFPVAHEIAHL